MSGVHATGGDSRAVLNSAVLKSNHLFWAYAIIGSSWLLLHSTGLLGSVGGITFVFIGLLSLTASAYGLRTHHVASRRPWQLMVAAMVIWIIGGAIRHSLQTLGDLSATRSVLPDVFGLTGYLLVGIGLTMLHHRRYKDRERDLDSLLDAAIAAMAVAAILWVVILVPALGAETTPLVKLLLVIYPVLTVALTTLTLRFVFSAAADGVTTHRLLIAALGFLLAGDAVYMTVELDLLAVPTTIIDLPYGMAFLTFGGALLHPSVSDAGREVMAKAARSDRFRLAAVALALAVPAAMTVVAGALSRSDRVALGVLGGLLTVGATWRVMRAMNAQAAVQLRLAHAASHDSLTGLPNRISLAGHLSQLARDTADRRIGALFADLDRFKLINDGLGHSVGDGLLQAVATRLRENVSASDFVARVGGDEFVIITVAQDPDTIQRLAERLRCCLGAPFRIGTTEIHATMSIGVRILEPNTRSELDPILEDADSALYQAKRKGRNTVVTFNHSMREWADRQLFLEQELNTALATGQIDVAYQPIVRLPDGIIEGFEALARWHHPDIGPIAPDVFIPVAEETGLVIEIGSWVLERACADLASWKRDELVGQVTMSVNLSPRQLVDHSLVDAVRQTMARHGLSAGALQLEITEGMLMEDPDAARRLLNDLRDVGVRISLDDFGTGYSSIAQLKSFPVDSVKIDRSFVNGIGYAEPSSDETLVAAIVAMSDALGFRTIAEGVETADQAARLFELGVRSAQGYHFSRPVHRDAIGEVLDSLKQRLPH